MSRGRSTRHGVFLRRRHCPTFRLSGTAGRWRLIALEFAAGGADRARTGDPLVANQVLSQLSYSPSSSGLVGLSGFEPLTSRLSAVRSSQLSYRPVAPLISPPRLLRGLWVSRGRSAKEHHPAPGPSGGSLKTE
jgi:hypothetical protein